MPARIALVTGASSGVGRATAIALNKAGWTTVLAARRQAELEETVGMMDPEGRDRTMVVPVDLTDEQGVRDMFRKIQEVYGRLDVLFNNAGSGAPRMNIEDLPLAEYRKTMEINVTACFLCCQEAFRVMKAQTPRGGSDNDFGRIINNGSVSAYAPRPQAAPYTMSKHAILGLTKTLAVDGRPFNIACSQLDIGNALTSINADKQSVGYLQPDGSMRTESSFDVKYAADAVVFMANLPLEVNILNQTIMATDMPFIGRG